MGVQVRAGRCRVQVVAGQMLPGGAPHLLLILAASMPGQQLMPTPLHLFSCHVVDIATQEAKVKLQVQAWRHVASTLQSSDVSAPSNVQKV